LGDILIQIEHYDIPTSAQLGVDMSLSILDVDVSEQLERLSMAIATASVENVEQELQDQIEVFVELAEILNKPGLGAIAETVRDAMNTQPLEQIIPIAETALQNFQMYQETLLASGGKHEIPPSEELLSFTRQSEHQDEFIWETAGLEPNFWNDLSDSMIIDGELVGDIDADLKKEITEELTSPISEVISPQESSLFSFADLLDTLEEIQPAISLDTTSLDAISLDTASLDTTDVLNPTNVLNSTDVLDPTDVELPTRLTVKPIRPASTDAPPFTTFPPPPPPISAQIPHHEIPVAPKVTTRVNSEKLERMNNLVNEAVIQRSSLSLENEQIQKSVRELSNRFAAIERIVVQLRKVSDRTLISPPHTTGIGLEGSRGGTQSANPDFDSLEMDSYGTLHSLLQQFLEDMIQLRETADDIDLFTKRSDKNLAALRKSLNYLQDDFMWVRMLPIGEVLNRFPRMLRDLSITYQKPVKLQLSGTEVLVDRAVAERIYDPLLHLLRNAFDHGIEAAPLRLQRGKPEEGLIQIKAFHRGGQTVIEVSDDGEGLNLQRIGQRAL
ncbi:MAG TPA: hybrid sensor histidine kinase/response regulator, partial [Allocoleopsis sp.]